MRAGRAKARRLQNVTRDTRSADASTEGGKLGQETQAQE
jgi:hypothetical protein